MALVEEAAAAAESLVDQAGSLMDAVSIFVRRERASICRLPLTLTPYCVESIVRRSAIALSIVTVNRVKEISATQKPFVC
jgi:hypothetical protein